MTVTIESKLGTFTKIAPTLSFTDQAGNRLDYIEQGKTVVHGPWKLVTKAQLAIVRLIVTGNMLNATGSDEKKANFGKPVFKFKGNGWSPEADINDIVMQDAHNPADRWACKPEHFGDAGWQGSAPDADMNAYYSKHGKPLLALELPAGTRVHSKEGARTVGAGHYLAMTNPNVGDFYVWTPDVVANYVKPYVSSNI